MKPTAMAQALKSAGRDVQKDMLYICAQKCLAAHDNSVIAPAIEKFNTAIVADIKLLVALIKPETIKAAAVGYLRTVAADMSGTPERGDQTRLATLAGNVPAASATNGAEEGQIPCDAHAQPASSAPPNKDDRGQPQRETQVVSAPSSIASETGHVKCDAHQGTARPAREPTTVQHETDARVAKLVAVSVMDTFKVTERQGTRTSIGDLPVRRLAQLARQVGKKAWVGGREAELLLICDAYVKKQARVPAEALVRDILSVDLVNAAIDKAAEIAGLQRRITTIIHEVAHG